MKPYNRGFVTGFSVCNLFSIYKFKSFDDYIDECRKDIMDSKKAYIVSSTLFERKLINVYKEYIDDDSMNDKNKWEEMENSLEIQMDSIIHLYKVLDEIWYTYYGNCESLLLKDLNFVPLDVLYRKYSDLINIGKQKFLYNVKKPYKVIRTKDELIINGKNILTANDTEDTI
jgi:hypothetical protein